MLGDLQEASAGAETDVSTKSSPDLSSTSDGVGVTSLPLPGELVASSQEASAEPFRECPPYPKTGHVASPLKESAMCHKQTWHSRMAVHCTPGENAGIVDV